MVKKTDDKFIEKLICYTEKLNNLTFRDYQSDKVAKIYKSVLFNDGATFTTLWARKAGKSMMLRAVFFGLMCLMPALGYTAMAVDFSILKRFREGFTSVIAGPKIQTAGILFQELRRQSKTAHFKTCFKELDLDITISNLLHFELSNGSKAQAFSGSENASNEGPEADLLAIDEASMLTPFSIYKILKPFCAASNGTIIEAGTPGKKRCAFLTDINFNKRYYPERHVAIPYDLVVPHSKTYARFIENQLLSLPGGIDNPSFKQNFLLEWTISENNFVEPEYFQSLATAIRYEISPNTVLSAGIDWGKVNSDTCCTILEYNQHSVRIIDLLNISGRYTEQLEVLKLFLHSYNLSCIIPESNNIGDPMSEKIEEEFGKIVRPTFMSVPMQDKIFTNLLMFLTAKPPRFAWYDDNSRESKMFAQQFMDAEQQMKGNFLCVHKMDADGSKDDFLFSTALALEGALTTKLRSGSAFGYKSTGKTRNVLDILKDY